MRFCLRALIIGAGLAAVAALAIACESVPRFAVTIPSNISFLKAVEPGASLAQYGYTPVVNLYNQDGKANGYIAVVCPTANLMQCGRNRANEGTMSRPVVYVVNGLIFVLQGPHASSSDVRRYFVAVPVAYQNFGKLTAAQQRQLLYVMPEVKHAIGDPADERLREVMLSIGHATVWVGYNLSVLWTVVDAAMIGLSRPPPGSFRAFLFVLTSTNVCLC